MKPTTAIPPQYNITPIGSGRTSYLLGYNNGVVGVIELPSLQTTTYGKIFPSGMRHNEEIRKNFNSMK
jgi:hypothetical protein